MKSPALLLVACLGLLGCPRDPSTDGGPLADAGAESDAGVVPDGGVDGGHDAGPVVRDGGPVATQTGFCAAFAEATCAAHERCGNLAAAQAAYCREIFAISCTSFVGNRLVAGAAKLNLPLAQACLDALTDRPCQTLDTRDETPTCRMEKMLMPGASGGDACGGPGDCLQGTCTSTLTSRCPRCVVGQAQPGDVCRFYDCAPTAYCARFPQTDGGLELRCAAKASDGVACTDRSQCASDNCYKWAAAGGARCGKADAGERCLLSLDEDCLPGHYCKDVAGTQFGACTPRVPDGQPCTNGLYTDGCATAGASCIGGQCVRTPLGVLELGKECDEHYQCRSGLFCEGLTYGTSATGFCAAWRKVGDGCDIRHGNTGCPPGARCSRDRCVAMSEVMGPCTQGAECKFLLACAQDGGCVGAGVLGGPCEGASGCQGSYCTGTFIFSGTCRERRDAGERCSNANDVINSNACKSFACYSAADGGDFAECVDCLSGQ